MSAIPYNPGEDAAPSHPVDSAQVKSGHLMAFTYWAIVKNVHRGGHNLDVVSVDNGMPFGVNGRELVEAATSADFHTEERKVALTRVAEQLVASVNRPFTVCFKKQEGEERVLRGRLIRAEPILGRSMVEDLDIPHDDKKGRVRLVDHRTLVYLIVDGVMYRVK